MTTSEPVADAGDPLVARRVEGLRDVASYLGEIGAPDYAREVYGAAAEIARLTRERDEALREQDRADADRSAAENDLHDAEERFQNEVARLRSALEPFAAEAESYDPDEGDGEYAAWRFHFKIGDLRRARAALSPAQNPKGQP